MPSMMPFAIDGAAPRMTTKRMALSLSWNNTMPSGTHATDGIVCSPVIMDPIAARSTGTRATASPTTPPITIDDPNPTAARRIVVDHRVPEVVAVGRELVQHRERRRDDVFGLPARPHQDLPRRR